MKSKILALAILAFTAAAVGLYPQLQGAAIGKPVTATPPAPDPLANTKPRVEVAFVLDTTGSMGGLIQAAKEKIWSIAGTMAAAQPAPEIRMGLVAYRDRGDAYVTRVVDLSSDLDSVYATLMDFQAQGGGDGPESVNHALHDAVQKLSWSQDDQTYRVIFLVGDAPPHMDYPNDDKWPATLEVAQSRGIRVNTIQCGQMPATKEEWRKIAHLGQGSFFQVEQAGSAVAIATPMMSGSPSCRRSWTGRASTMATKRTR
jgi:Mg-chelatase subunit ChlD